MLEYRLQPPLLWLRRTEYRRRLYSLTRDLLLERLYCLRIGLNLYGRRERLRCREGLRCLKLLRFREQLRFLDFLRECDLWRLEDLICLCSNNFLLLLSEICSESLRLKDVSEDEDEEEEEEDAE